MSAVDRRSFLKGIAAAAACTAVDVRATGASAPVRSAVSWQPAPCTLCSAGCEMLVDIRDGRATAVKPAAGASACAKGYHILQTLRAPDRVTRARIRRDGALADAPLGEALDLVARRLADTIARHGAHSAALLGPAEWSGCDGTAGQDFFRNVLGARFVDTESRLDGGSGRAGLLTSLGGSVPAATYDDFEHADTFIVWNQNLAETHPVLFARMLARRRANPAVRIIDVGTRTTRTSYGADRALLFQPHSQLALLNGIAQQMVARRLVHRDFIARHVAFRRGATDIGDGTAAQGLQLDRAEDSTWQEYTRFLDEYTPERVQRLTGVRAEDVTWLAGLLGDRSRRVLSVWGAGLGRDVRGTWANNLLHNLHLLTGRISAPGDGALCVDTQGTGGGAETGTLEMFRALERGDVRFLWIQAADPLMSLPDVARYRRAAVAADCFIVVSAVYPMPTTDVADVILPTALWIEQEGTMLDATHAPHAVPRLLRPPGDARSLEEQTHEVARRAGSQPAPRRATLSAPPRRYTSADDDSVVDFPGYADRRARIWLRPHMSAVEPATPQFPFRLLVGDVLEHTGTGALTRRVPALHRAQPRAYAELNRDDAQALGISAGQHVRLVSRRGAVTVEARVDQRSQPPRGVVFLPRFDEAHAANLLTLAASCPLSGQPQYDCAVRIERAPGGAS